MPSCLFLVSGVFLVGLGGFQKEAGMEGRRRKDKRRKRGEKEERREGREKKMKKGENEFPDLVEP